MQELQEMGGVSHTSFQRRQRRAEDALRVHGPYSEADSMHAELRALRRMKLARKGTSLPSQRPKPCYCVPENLHRAECDGSVEPGGFLNIGHMQCHC